MDKAIICFQTGIAVIFVKTISENEPLYKLRIIFNFILKTIDEWQIWLYNKNGS